MKESRVRIAVTGLRGQVVSSLIERAQRDVEIIALGRPQLDLSIRGAVLGSLRHAGCDLIINAAAYTQVDRAEEEPEIARHINADGAQSVAQAAAELKLPLIQLSTDYVFDGKLQRPYCESDLACPDTAYGKSKLLGEKKISETLDNFVILRTSWVFSPFGQNFIKTMLRLMNERKKISVVDDQIGNPTSAIDIADKIFIIARKLINDPSSELRGLFHLSGTGAATWADFAQEIFSIAGKNGLSVPRLIKIATKDYPTAASRPQNSRLDNSKINETYGIEMPLWQNSVAVCVERLLGENH